MSAAPGFEVRTSTSTPAALPLRAAAARAVETNGVERIRAHQRIDRHEIDTQPFDAAERRVADAKKRPCVGTGTHIDVAALAVGDHEQTLRLGMAHHRCEQRPANVAQAPRSEPVAA